MVDTLMGTKCQDCCPVRVSAPLATGQLSLNALPRTQSTAQDMAVQVAAITARNNNDRGPTGNSI
jgi:hypothetical protein